VASHHNETEPTHRTTTTHVILETCPFCSKPTHGQADNCYKLYVQVGGGAYFCHRCGTGGSWFDFKAKLSSAVSVEGGSHTSQHASSSHNSPPSGTPSGGSRKERDFWNASSSVSSRNRTVEPLPLPSPRLQALYSSQLLDHPKQGDTTTTKETTNTTSTTEEWGQNRALQYLLNERGLTVQTLRKYGVGRAQYSFPTKDKHEWVQAECVSFPWIMRVSEVEYQEELRGAAVQKSDTKSTSTTRESTTTKQQKDTFVTRRIKARALDDKSWQRMDPPGGGWGFFGYHTIPSDAKEIVLTEGEYDAMAVSQATGRPAISLPNGCRSLPVEALPLLEDFDKIYLWMDNDGPGQEGAELFAKKIGLGRCYIVRPTPQNTGTDVLPKDANEALLQNLDLERIVSDAKLVPHERILSFEDLRSSVLHEILHPEKYVGTPVPSLPGFTKLIQGVRKGELTVITGPTGSGAYPWVCLLS
jgi:twinkle protein